MVVSLVAFYDVINYNVFMSVPKIVNRVLKT